MPNTNELLTLQAARAAGITSPDELANFMAQMGHESLGFTRLEEGFRYTRGIDAIPVQSAFREGRQTLEAARVAALEGRPQELARLMYGGRMGNDDAGDGYLYRGRGFTMLTGEANYRDAGTDLGIDLVRRPELAANADTASRIAVGYWLDRVPEAQREDVSAATVRVNGGTNGLQDRYDRFDAWQRRLTPQFLADLDAGRIRPGAAVGPASAREIADDGELRRLESGDEVRTLQRDLRQLDLAQGRRRPIAESGTFDSPTEEAVRRFQRTHGTTVTGRVDDTLQRSIRDAAEATRDAAPGHRAGAAPGAPPGTTREDRRAALSPDDLRMLDDVSTHVHALDRAHGRAPDAGSERLAWAVFAEANTAGLSRVDHVVLSIDGASVRAGQNIFAVQGGLQDERNRVAFLDTARGLAQPVEASLVRATEGVERSHVAVSAHVIQAAPVAPHHRLA